MSGVDVAAFRRDGFVVVPGVLTVDEVARLRRDLEARFAAIGDQPRPGERAGFLVDPMSRYPELRWLLFHDRTVAVLRNLLGDDYVVLRESVVQREQFGVWHKDTTGPERNGLAAVTAHDFLMVEAAFYLQDNDPELGGGLDVEPGSHLEADSFAAQSLVERAGRKVLRMLWKPFAERRRRGVRVESRSGDLVVFNFRTTHRATPRHRAPAPGGEKLAIFVACSTNTPHVGAYHDYLTTHPDYGYLRDFAYPEELLEEAARHRVTLA